MCGILGWIDPALIDRDAAIRMAEPALSVLRSRGPDDRRIEWGPGWTLGHTRLAIIDLSRASSQPMTDGRGLWLVYNGEIYNFRELRAELETKGSHFTSDGDAEVLLHALKEWGVGCLERLRGMFAFALFDTNTRELVLARDRYGVKPLAYEPHGAGIRFASDLRALRSLPNARREIDSESAYLYMALGYIPAPHSIHRNVRKVKPGHYVRVRWSDAGVDDIRETPYWSIRALDENSHAGNSLDDDDDLMPEFERRVSDAVRCRLISDVPVGSLLSGGIDSTLVTSFARELSDSPVPAFTMGFDDAGFDEAPFARAIAKELGGSHHEFLMTDADVEYACNEMWSAYDEPFGDSSAIPTLLLSRRVASSVKVAMTGDGGDETGCGYPWHQALNRYDQFGTDCGVTDTRADRMARFRKRHRIPEHKSVDRAEIWSTLRTGLSDEMLGILPVADPHAKKPLSEYFRDWSRDLSDVEECFTWAAKMDFLTYVPDDLMVKADRASMSAGLELRSPFLDHDLTAWMLQTPVSARFDRQGCVTKVLSRRSLERRVSGAQLERPKQGFSPPLSRWLSGPLAEQVADALQRLETGALDPLILPRGCTRWDDTDPAIRDGNIDFLWRIVSFSEWSKHAGDP